MRHITEVARRKVSGPPEWEVYAWEHIGDTHDLLVTGGVPRLLKSGPRKGKKTWDGKGEKAVVTRAEMDEEQRRYECDTGNCGECLGSGEVFAGWSSTDGVKMKACRQCGGSGKAKEPTDG
jgi:hypothetical protein